MKRTPSLQPRLTEQLRFGSSGSKIRFRAILQSLNSELLNITKANNSRHKSSSTHDNRDGVFAVAPLSHSGNRSLSASDGLEGSMRIFPSNASSSEGLHAIAASATTTATAAAKASSSEGRPEGMVVDSSALRHMQMSGFKPPYSSAVETTKKVCSSTSSVSDGSSSPMMGDARDMASSVALSPHTAAVSTPSAGAAARMSGDSSASTGMKMNSTFYDSVPFTERWDNIRRALSVLGNISEGNTVTVYKDSGEAYQAMWKAIDESKREVLWQTYICKDDHVGRTTVQKLLAAHRRRCRTELLYDDGGNISGRTKLMEPLRRAGVSVIVYRPILSYMWRYLCTFDWRISPGLRNHRKILLVDEKIGFCGGLNIGNEYCGKQSGGTGRFRDTHCSVVGPALGHLRKVYDDTKVPQPTRSSFARWRQRASLQWSRTYRSGSTAIMSRIVKPLQKRTSHARYRSGLYVRKQLSRMAQRSNQSVSGFLDRMDWNEMRRNVSRYPSQYLRAKIEGMAAGNSSPTAVNRSSSLRPDAGEKQKSRAARWSRFVEALNQAKSRAAQRGHGHATQKEESLGVASEKRGMEVLRSGATFRKMYAERMHHLSAFIASKKRKATRALRQRPLSDTEPVPEAALYAQRVPPTTQIIQSNPRHDDYSIQYALWQVVRKCHRRVWVTTPYYLPSAKHVKAMVHAAGRGVDVRVLTGSKRTTDPWFMWYASTYITDVLLRAGVRVFEFKGDGVMHAKTVVADSIWSSVGSFNWDPMSNKNLEVCLCHLDPITASVMETHFLEDLAESEEVTLEKHRQRPVWIRCASWLFYHFVFVLHRLSFPSSEVPDLDYAHSPASSTTGQRKE